VLFGFSTPNGYAQLTPGYTVDVWGDQNRPGLMTALSRLGDTFFEVRPPYRRLLAMNNVRFVLSPLPIRGDSLNLESRVGKVLIYRVPEAFPRAFVVPRYRLASNGQESLRILADASFDPAREAILFDRPGFQGDDRVHGEATIILDRTNEIELRVNSTGPALLVLSDTFYKGWEAEIDGKSVAIVRANHSMRGVEIPPGNHAVRFAFRPRSVLIGFLLSAACLLGITAALVWTHRRGP
jgi:hypothetical protein